MLMIYSRLQNNIKHIICGFYFLIQRHSYSRTYLNSNYNNRRLNICHRLQTLA